MIEKLTELGWAHQLDVSSLLTPIGECICLPVGFVNDLVLNQLRVNDFDHCPILDTSGQPIGVMPKDDALSFKEADQQIEASHSALNTTALTKTPNVRTLLSTLHDNTAVLVLDRDELAEQGSEGVAVGMITFSDLNRHAFRSYLYEVLAEIECDLASFLERRCQDHWEWISRLSEDKQARIIGYWEIAKRRNVDVGPVAACVLSELLNVMARFEPLRATLGYASRRKFEEECESAKIIEVRNRVMHPVRPLVVSQPNLVEVQDALEGVFSLAERLRSKGLNL